MGLLIALFIGTLVYSGIIENKKNIGEKNFLLNDVNYFNISNDSYKFKKNLNLQINFSKENILSFWKNDDEVLNQIENKGKFDKKFFSSISVILSKEKLVLMKKSIKLLQKI